MSTANAGMGWKVSKNYNRVQRVRLEESVLREMRESVLNRL
jgi:hypothetical protein